MALLPLFKLEDDLQGTLWQTKWKSILDPVISSPIINGLLLTNVQLSPGITAIPHKLARLQQGYIIVYHNSALGELTPSQPLNDTNLYLQGSSTSLLSLWVF
jgi:hypothetical protein